MATYTKALDLYKAQLRRFDRLGGTMRQLHHQIADDGLADGQGITGGALTPSQTRGAFARDGGSAGIRRALTSRQKKGRGLRKSGAPLLPINVQSGKLQRSIKLVDRTSGKKQSFDLTQVDPGGGIYTLYPGGTKKMVGRSYHTEIKRRWRIRNKALIDHFVSLQRKP